MNNNINDDMYAGVCTCNLTYYNNHSYKIHKFYNNNAKQYLSSKRSRSTRSHHIFCLTLSRSFHVFCSTLQYSYMLYNYCCVRLDSNDNN